MGEACATLAQQVRHSTRRRHAIRLVTRVVPRLHCAALDNLLPQGVDNLTRAECSCESLFLCHTFEPEPVASDPPGHWCTQRLPAHSLSRYAFGIRSRYTSTPRVSRRVRMQRDAARWDGHRRSLRLCTSIQYTRRMMLTWNTPGAGKSARAHRTSVLRVIHSRRRRVAVARA